MSFQYLYVRFALTRLRLADAKERKNPSAAKGLPKAMQEPPLSKCKLSGTWCFFEALCDTILLWKLLDLWLLHQETPRRHKESRRNTQATALQALLAFIVLCAAPWTYVFGFCFINCKVRCTLYFEAVCDTILLWKLLDLWLLHQETPRRHKEPRRNTQAVLECIGFCFRNT
jgi:hypothetical protein